MRKIIIGLAAIIVATLPSVAVADTTAHTSNYRASNYQVHVR